MILSTCPRCSESLRIPTGDLPDGAYAECPWCRETFPASELIDRLPPVVHLMDSGGNPLVLKSSQLVAGASSANPFAGAVTSDRWDAGQETEPGAAVEQGPQDFEALNFGGAPATGAVDIQLQDPEGDASNERPMRVRSKQAGKKKKSGLGTLVGIALGPFLALPLAGAILLAIGRAPDLGFWPFDGSFNGRGGPTRSAAPALDSNASTQRLGGSSRQTPRTLNSGGSLLDDGSEVAEAVKAITGSESSEPNEALEVDLQPPSNQSEDLAAANAASMPDLSELLNLVEPPEESETPDPLALPEGTALYPGDAQAVSVSKDNTSEDNSDANSEPDPQVSLKPETVVISDPTEQLPDTTEDLGPDGGATETQPLALPQDLTESVDSPKLKATVAAALGSMRNLAEMSEQSAATKKDFGQTYVNIAKVADQQLPVDSDAVAELLKETAASSVLEDLAAIGPRWWGYSTRTHDGMLLIGVVVDQQTIRLRGKSDDADTDVPVRIPEGIAVPDAERVIAFGRIKNAGDGRVVVISAIQPIP